VRRSRQKGENKKETAGPTVGPPHVGDAELREEMISLWPHMIFVGKPRAVSPPYDRKGRRGER
jgi:hypothetical protein